MKTIILIIFLTLNILGCAYHKDRFAIPQQEGMASLYTIFTEVDGVYFTDSEGFASLNKRSDITTSYIERLKTIILRCNNELNN